MSLTNKQRVFVEEYLQCWNATEAARRANYANPNTQGPRLLVNVSIATEIKRRIDEKAMSADEVLARLARHARGSLEDFFRFEDGIKQPFLDLKKAQENGNLDLLKKLKRDKDGKIEIELHDPQAALVHLGKYHGLFTDKIEGSIKVDGSLVILPPQK